MPSSKPSLRAPVPARASGPFANKLTGLVWLRAQTWGARPFVEAADGSRAVTYAEVHRAVERWRTLLGDLGVPQGAAVGIAVGDPVDFALVFLGVMAAGRIAAPFDPRATGPELVTVAGRVSPHLVVADRPAPDGQIGDWLVLPTGSFALAAESAPVSAPAGGPTHDSRPPDGPRAGGLVLTTSGTTGTPKLIVLDEDRLLHTAGAVARHHRLSVADRGFNPLPLFHINAEVVGLLATLCAGATLVLADRFHRTGFWATMRSRRVTWINAVPAILARLSPLAAGESVPEGIRFARSASAPLPAAVLERFELETGVPVVETYGMTEAASQITANPVEGVRRPGSVGRPVESEVRVRAEAGEIGPVMIRGPGVIAGYAGTGYEDRVDADGWLDTGDLGYVDDGWLFLVGRADDVINCGGEKVYPKEVEDVILGDADVATAAVVGEDHEVLGRVPVAYLVVPAVSAEGSRQRARDVAEAVVRRVQTRCTRQLSKPKRPAAFHVVASLPEGANGKLRRRAIGGEPSLYTLLAR